MEDGEDAGIGHGKPGMVILCEAMASSGWFTRHCLLAPPTSGSTANIPLPQAGERRGERRADEGVREVSRLV